LRWSARRSVVGYGERMHAAAGPVRKEVAMSEHTKSARAKADAEFEKVQTQAREREKVRDTRDEVEQARDDNIARLKAQRLARDAAGTSSK
jgi:hypothetical protein